MLHQLVLQRVEQPSDFQTNETTRLSPFLYPQKEGLVLSTFRFQ
jgi:hypothetical protein